MKEAFQTDILNTISKMENYSQEISKVIKDYGWTKERDLERKRIHRALFHLRKALDSLDLAV